MRASAGPRTGARMTPRASLSSSFDKQIERPDPMTKLQTYLSRTRQFLAPVVLVTALSVIDGAAAAGAGTAVDADRLAAAEH